MLVSCFAACNKEPAKTTPSSTPSNQGPDEPEDVPEEEKLNIEKVNHDQHIVTVFHWGPDQEEFGMEEDQVQGDDVKDALYQRNLKTEEHLGVDLQFHKAGYAYNTVSKFITDLEAMVGDPMTPVDIIAAQTRMMPTVLIEGYLIDLNVYSDTIDLDKAWWPENCREEHELKDKLYFLSGDISPNLLRMMTAVFVNKSLLTSIGYDYDVFMNDVLNYKWTIDVLMEMANTYGYTDGTGEGAVSGPSVDDNFGLVSQWVHSDALYVGCGYTYMVKSNKDDEVFKMSPQILSLAVDDYVSKMVQWTETNVYWCNERGNTAYQTIFKEGRSLFLVHRCWFGFTLQDTELDYAVIPAPMLNEQQGEYLTTMGNPYSSYGICPNSGDLNISAEVIQVLGYYGYMKTTPVLFEVSFKGKFSKDDYTVQMFDIIRGGITFDVGRSFDSFISGPESENWKYYLANVVSFTISNDPAYCKSRSWGSEFNANKQDIIRRQIATANEKLLAVINAG